MKKKLLNKLNVFYHLNKEVWKDDKKYTLASLSHMSDGKLDPKTLTAGIVDENGAYSECDVNKAKLEVRKAVKAFDFKKKKEDGGAPKKAAPKKAAKKKAEATAPESSED